MFFSWLPPELRLQVYEELQSDDIAIQSLSATCSQAYAEVRFYRSKVFEVSFQSLDQFKQYIETRTSLTLQHPHHVTVVFSGVAPAQEWKAAVKINLRTLELILTPASVYLLPKMYSNCLMRLQGARNLFLLRGLSLVNLTFQCRSAMCRIYKKAYPDLPCFKRNLKLLTRPLSFRQKLIRERVQRPAQSRHMTRARFKAMESR